jgi:tripartite-type tricarboxylate transporter receptor subunit TctC
MHVLHRGLLIAIVLLGPGHYAPAFAQDYPTRALSVIVPWPAGGAVDTLARLVMPRLADRLGKPIVIENRPGAGSTLGSALGAKATPDGYTLSMPGSGSMAIAPTLYKKLPYDPIKDFAPVALVGRIPFVLVVNPHLGVRSVPDLLRLAQEKPGTLSYGSGGAGSPHHLYAELFGTMTGIKMTHIPYKGSAPAIADVVAGHVPLMFSDPAPSVPLVREGKVVALGVSTTTRWAAAPEIPPLAEAGVPGFDASGWVMLAVPAGTSQEIVNRLHAELRGILESSDLQQLVTRAGMIPVASPPPPEDMPRFVATELARWSKVVVQAGLAGSE